MWQVVSRSIQKGKKKLKFKAFTGVEKGGEPGEIELS